MPLDLADQDGWRLPNGKELEVDDLAKDLYQDLMACYWQLSRRADALSLYEGYKETLSTKLGTEALFGNRNDTRIPPIQLQANELRTNFIQSLDSPLRDLFINFMLCPVHSPQQRTT